MRKYLFKKAKILNPQKIGETQYFILFKVNDYDVMIGYKNYKLVFSCTCKAGSLKPDQLCSHVLSCLNWLIENG